MVCLCKENSECVALFFYNELLELCVIRNGLVAKDNELNLARHVEVAPRLVKVVEVSRRGGQCKR
jgi:hypothetical protein